MQQEFVPYGEYEDIINLIGQWKILDMKALKELSNYKLKYRNLLHKVQKLERHGLIRGVLLGRKNKHVFLTQKGIKYTPYDTTFEISNENLTHDLIAARVLRDLLNYKGFKEGRMYHQITSDKLLPDAEIIGAKNGETYRMALEVELTQKSQDRVKEKFRLYGNGQGFSYALFITNKETLFNTYKRFLLEMKADVQDGVILLLDKSLSVTKFSYARAECFFMGKTMCFEDLF
mgnify:CR=1 FL=1